MNWKEHWWVFLLFAAFIFLNLLSVIAWGYETMPQEWK